jgi:hypothetical protein
MNNLSLKQPLLIALFVSILFLSGWEWYCRDLGFIATMEDTKELWAETRAKLEDNNPNQIVSVSASRGHFDFQLNEWEQASGIRPIMLSAGGRGPAAVFQDIVENTNYTGTILMNVTPSLFFVPPADSVFGWWRGKEWVDYYNKRTYAQIFNHQLSYILQPHLAFLTSGSEGDVDLKSLVQDWQNTNDRVKSDIPFPRFEFIDADRNVTMMSKVVTDTAFAAIIQRVWMENRKDSINELEYAKPIIFEFYVDLIKKFQARGGRVILTRNPSHGKLRAYERIVHPRKEYWDKFIEVANCPAYHFEDYPQLNQFFTPEWSHLATPDARIYTKELVKILQQDGVL